MNLRIQRDVEASRVPREGWGLESTAGPGYLFADIRHASGMSDKNSKYLPTLLKAAGSWQKETARWLMMKWYSVVF